MWLQQFVTPFKTGGNYFDEALCEAQKGVGFTHPNPPVGCVIVKNGNIIGRGYHRKAGEAHAEVEALQEAGQEAQGADLYVTLEPCNHFGYTPPCVQAIIRAGITRVFYGVQDPNPKVDGSGIQALQQAGVKVQAVLDSKQKEKAEDLILPFKKWLQKKQPYMIAKIAASLDGKIAQKPGVRTAITSPEVLRWVHELREKSDAVMVGSETVLIDNPKLTVRFQDRLAKRQPVRIILDRRLRTHPEKHLVYTKDGVQSYVVYGTEVSFKKLKIFEKAGVILIKQENFLERMASLGLTQILLEGGGQVLSSFIQSGWIDELAWLSAPKLMGQQGVSAIGELTEPLRISSCQTHEFLSKDRLCLILLVN